MSFLRQTQLGGGPHITLLDNGLLLIAGNKPYAANYLQDRYYLAVSDPADGSVLWEMEYAEMGKFQYFSPPKKPPTATS